MLHGQLNDRPITVHSAPGSAGTRSAESFVCRQPVLSRPSTRLTDSATSDPPW